MNDWMNSRCGFELEFGMTAGGEDGREEVREDGLIAYERDLSLPLFPSGRMRSNTSGSSNTALDYTHR